MNSSLEELLDRFSAGDDHRETIFHKIVNWFLSSEGTYRTRSDLINLIRTELDRIDARTAWIAREAHRYKSHLKSLGVEFENDAIAEFRREIFSTDINSIILVKSSNTNSAMLSAVKLNQALHDSGEVDELSIGMHGEAFENFVPFHDDEDIFSYLPRCFFFIVHCSRQVGKEVNHLIAAFGNRAAG